MRKKRKGFVLVLVLAMLTIAALLAAGLARRSLDQTVAAAKKEVEMQRRWGEISCRQAVLNRAEILLRTAELRDGLTTPVLQSTVKLGGLTFQIMLSDEQAKLNLNTVFRNGGLTAVRQAVFFDSSGWQFRLRPDSRATKNSIYPPAFGSWGQVYDFSVWASQDEKNYSALTQLGRQTTCWGNGLLNMKRAETQTLRFLCEQVAAPQSVSHLTEMRREHPAYTLDQLLKETDISDKDRRAFRKILTDKSRCHSLWIITGNGQRAWARLDIRETEAATGNDTRTFYW